MAAKLTVEKYAHANRVRVINSPVKEEDADNQRFLKEVERWIGVKIETAINPKFPSASAAEVWERKKYMSGLTGAPCTVELKKEARYHWEKENKADYHVLGFTAEEKHRFDRFVLTERSNVLPVLIDAGLSKADCFRMVQQAGIDLPWIYSQGYPNANCVGCVKATSPTYWNLVREKHPEVFKERLEQSEKLGVKLVRIDGRRAFLSELDPGHKGRALKAYNFECGIFCEER